MQKTRIPLVGITNFRPIASGSYSASKDQYFQGCLSYEIVNPVTRTKTVHLYKRPGLTPSATLQSGSAGQGAFLSPFNAVAYTSFNTGTTSTIYANATSCGSVTGRTLHFTEAVFSNVGYILITSDNNSVGTGGTGWYIASDSYANLAYTADGNNSTTITDIKVGGVASVAGLYVGQKLTAASNIVAGSRIVSINAGAFSAVLDTATTGGSFNDLAITKEPIAKQNDPDFPTNITGGFAELDGTIYIMTLIGTVRGSDLNSISSWTSTNSITANIATDGGVGLVKYKNNIVAFGTDSAEWFYNAGNASGSLLNAAPQLASGIGAWGGMALGQGATIASQYDVLAWVSKTQDLYRMDGSTPKPLTSVGTGFAGDGTFGIFQIQNKTYINTTTGGGIPSWYDISSGFVALPRPSGQDYQLFISSGLDSNGVQQVIATVGNGDTTGKRYVLNSAAGADNNVAFSMRVVTSPLDFGTPNRKFHSRITLDAGDKQSSGTATLERSDDDFTTWRTLGTFDCTKRYPFITRCGSHRGGSSFRLTHSAATEFRASALIFEYEVGET